MKQIVNILFCITLLLFSATGFTPTILPEDLSLINLQVMKPSGLEKQDGAASLLEERLIQAVILNGIACAVSPFRLTTHIRELSSQITTSTPPQYVTELEVTCFITDQVEKITLQQTTFHVKGVARTKEKAFRNAIEQIQARNPKLKTLLKKGKEKILLYLLNKEEETR